MVRHPTSIRGQLCPWTTSSIGPLTKAATGASPEDDDPELVISDVGFTTNFYRTVTEYRYVPSSTLDNELKVSVGRDPQFNNGQDL